jgi:hypothetical protein
MPTQTYIKTAAAPPRRLGVAPNMADSRHAGDCSVPRLRDLVCCIAGCLTCGRFAGGRTTDLRWRSVRQMEILPTRQSAIQQTRQSALPPRAFATVRHHTRRRLAASETFPIGIRICATTTGQPVELSLSRCVHGRWEVVSTKKDTVHRFKSATPAGWQKEPPTGHPRPVTFLIHL